MSSVLKKLTTSNERLDKLDWLKDVQRGKLWNLCCRVLAVHDTDSMSVETGFQEGAEAGGSAAAVGGSPHWIGCVHLQNSIAN